MGRGRPPLHGERKVLTSVRLTPKLIQFLHQHSDRSVACTIEEIVRRTKAFKEWEKGK